MWEIGSLMYQLIYLSDARSSLTPSALQQIVERSRQRNRTANVTGVAVMHGGVVMQLLEGPEAAVRATYARIARDHRHGNIAIMLTRRCRTRSFPAHPMAFHHVDEDDQSSVQMTMNMLRARHAMRMRAVNIAS